MSLTLVGVLSLSTPASASLCPAHKDLPLLTIDQLTESTVPVYDDWQVMWNGVPMSDAQVAELAGVGPLIDRTRVEIQKRGFWVYSGLIAAAVGAAVSGAGWMLHGRRSAEPGVTLSMGVGGLALTFGGFLMVSDTIQSSFEPHVAPTPRHRITREEMQGLVSAINNTLYGQICGAVLMVGDPGSDEGWQ
ncbi:MAG: hypothetical protein VX834_08950 [Myxococcota bacterium]|nr:hypothetical protein [Myxococcota bacterium]